MYKLLCVCSLLLLTVAGGSARGQEADSTGCCVGWVGDANGSGGEWPTISDISVIIDFLFISGNPDVIPCIAEADVNQSGGCEPEWSDITISDVALLILCSMLWIHQPEECYPHCLVCGPEQ